MKRWIIRSFFIGLLLLCVGGWVWRAYYDGTFQYGRGALSEKATSVKCLIWRGQIDVMFIQNDGQFLDDGWQSNVTEAHTQFWPSDDFRTSHYGLGFAIGHVNNKFTGQEFWELGVPFWFLVVVSSLTLWLVWRKTRAKAKARAFPVELAKPSEKP